VKTKPTATLELHYADGRWTIVSPDIQGLIVVSFYGLEDALNSVPMSWHLATAGKGLPTPYNMPAAKTQMSIGAILDEVQIKKLTAFMAEKSVKNTGAVGGQFSYLITNTTLGQVIKVIDQVSGDELDLSDYESW
jgi:hypothetical protein